MSIGPALGTTIRSNGSAIVALILGCVAYLWPGGVNVFLLFGSFLLFMIYIFEDDLEGEKNGSKRP